MAGFLSFMTPFGRANLSGGILPGSDPSTPVKAPIDAKSMVRDEAIGMPAPKTPTPAVDQMHEARVSKQPEQPVHLGELTLSALRGHGQPDVEHVDGNLLNAYAGIKKEMGVDIPIVAGYAKSGHVGHSEHYAGDALDLDVRHLNKAQQVQLIKVARKHEIKGIGVYAVGDNKARSFHIDLGRKWGRRAWGPNYHANSLPEWAKEALNG